VDDRFLARPKGATQSAQYGVMGLAKGITIARDPCLVLDALDCSVLINTMLLEYKLSQTIILIPEQATGIKQL